MNLKKIHKGAILIGYFLLVLAMGLFLYQDYGISLDEPAQRLIGIVNLNYVGQVFGIESIIGNAHFTNFSNLTLATLEDRHYGVIFELPAALMEIFFHAEDIRGIYLMRHLLTYFYFLLGVTSLYGLANLRFKDWRISLLACSMLILSPRIFSDAFYNDKDIVFMSVFSLASLTMIWFLMYPSWKKVIFHALTSAIAIDTRLIGIVIPLMTIIIFSARLPYMGMSTKRIAILALMYLTTFPLITITLWPYLWANPLTHLLEAFEFISRHPHSAALIFQGRETLTNQLPWYYIPVWISITTPILYLMSFSIGAIVNIRLLFIYQLKILQNNNQLIDAIFFALFLGPITAIAISHTSIYNGWRHLYFIYPFFILISINGLIKIWALIGTYRYGTIFLASVLSANFMYIASWMVINHPLQNLYFNSLAGQNWNSSYEIDYWGLANRIALQKILKIDKGDSITIWPGSNSKFKSGEPTVFSDQLLLEESKIRERVTSPDNIEDSKYIITSSKANYSPNYLWQHGMFEKIDSVSINGSEILAIFLRKDRNEILPPQKGQIISFAKSGLGIFYLYGNKNPPINWELGKSSDWQIPEGWGVWSNGSEATLAIPPFNYEIKHIVFKLRSFVGPQTPSQNTQIWINGHRIKDIDISSAASQEFVVDLPRNIDAKEGLRITFKGLLPRSPKQLGLSQDDRQIAIGLESIELR